MPSPPLVVPNAVQVRLLGLVGGQLAVNVLHAQKSGGLVITQTLTNTVGAAIKSAWTSRFGTLVTASGALVRVGLKDLTAANQTEFLDTGASVGGTAVGDTLPGQVAACVTLRTANSGKSARGRAYFGGFSETENVAGAVMSAAVAAAIVAFMQDVQSALTASTMTLGVLSRPAYAYVIEKTWTLPAGSTQTDTIGRGTARPGAILPVTLIQSRDTKWESQRRRSNGRGVPPTVFNGATTVEIVPFGT
jgi:hypothetical protein